MSSKGGGGFNEIRLEDKKGSEQIFIHGQKDRTYASKNDRREWIGEDRHLIVTATRRISLGRDEPQRHRARPYREDRPRPSPDDPGQGGHQDHRVAFDAVTGDVIEQFSGNHSSQVTQNLYLKAMQVVIEGDRPG
jgi:type VI secretion system secreted protein VgrG